MHDPPECSPDTPVPSADADLVRRYRDGDESAAADLFLRYARRLRALAGQYCGPPYAGRFDADDVVQSVFREFFAGVRRQAYDVPPTGELWGLLMVLALNKVRNLVGRHRAGKRSVQRTAPLPDADVLAADESAAALLRLVVAEQLDGLPESNRAVIRMRTEGYEVGEIAAHTGRSRRTVERVLQDFRARLTRT
jgi:RNA polymerase sigma-70 factor (ECF subfamily)